MCNVGTRGCKICRIGRVPTPHSTCGLITPKVRTTCEYKADRTALTKLDTVQQILSLLALTADSPHCRNREASGDAADMPPTVAIAGRPDRPRFRVAIVSAVNGPCAGWAAFR